MNTRFDVGDEVFVKAKINSLFRGYDSNGVFRDEYELRFDDHVDIRMSVPENKLYPVVYNQKDCEHSCGVCKHCYKYDSLTFLAYKCSKHKNNTVYFWQDACDDFEADDDEEEAK